METKGAFLFCPVETLTLKEHNPSRIVIFAKEIRLLLLSLLLYNYYYHFNYGREHFKKRKCSLYTRILKIEQNQYRRY